MSVFNKLFKKKGGTKRSPAAHSPKKPAAANVHDGPGKTGGVVFSAKDFSNSQSIYDRTLLGVDSYEIQSASSTDEQRSGDAIFGKLIDMTDGLLTLNVIMKRGSESLFSRGKKLLISYTMHGEPYAVKAVSLRPPIAGIDELDLKARKVMDNAIAQGYFGEAPGRKQWKYIIQVVLCEEPARYRRKHGRIEIEWDVYYKIDDGSREDEGSGDSGGEDYLSSYSLAKTIDISLGGFKCNIDKSLESGTLIKCVVDVGFGMVSKGKLIGKVIRCYLIANEIETYEMTVQFVDVAPAVHTFLSEWIEGILPKAVKAEAKAAVSEEDMEATIELLPPENNGADLTYDELCACLDGLRVTHGIDHDLLKQISQSPHYNYKYVVARCTPPVHGVDAQLIFHVDLNPSFAPRVNEMGMADFKDTGQIRKVSKNDVLAERTPPTVGKPGIGVTGDVINARQGYDKELPAGINTVINDDNTALLAESDGFISIVDGKINVLDTLVVEGDVHTATGNIDHNGIVIVKGDVRQGFSVTALGDVIIHGTVESAVVTAGGTLVVRGGCVGEKNSIDASGNVAINFIDGGTFKIGGSLTTSYILNSTVNCGDSVDMVGDALIRGSHVIAKNAINAKTVGSQRTAADHTVVEAGNDPELIARFEALAAELESLSRELEPIRENIRGLMAQKYKDELTEDKLVTLMHYKALAQELTERQKEVAEKYAAEKGIIESLGYGSIAVKDIAYGGLKVIIGSREMVLKESVKSALFRRNNDGVVIDPLE